MPDTIDALRQWVPLATKYAKKYGLPVELLLGTWGYESGGNPKAVSAAGAVGLGQVMPSERGFTGRPSAKELENPDTNAEWSARILSEGVKRWGSIEKGLAAYLGTIDQRGNITGSDPYTGVSGNQYVSQIKQLAGAAATRLVGLTAGGTAEAAGDEELANLDEWDILPGAGGGEGAGGATSSTRSTDPYAPPWSGEQDTGGADVAAGDDELDLGGDGTPIDTVSAYTALARSLASQIKQLRTEQGNVAADMPSAKARIGTQINNLTSQYRQALQQIAIANRPTSDSLSGQAALQNAATNATQEARQGQEGAAGIALRGAEVQLGRDRLGQEGQQFTARLGQDAARLGQEGEQFNTRLDFDKVTQQANVEAQRIQNEISQGRLDYEKGKAQWDQWFQRNVSLPLELQKMNASSASEQRAARADASRQTLEGGRYDVERQRVGAEAGNQAVSRELELQKGRVGPGFTGAMSDAINTLSRGGGATNFTPEMFTTPEPDLDAIAKKATADALKDISPYAAMMANQQAPDMGAGGQQIDIAEFLKNMPAPSFG